MAVPLDSRLISILIDNYFEIFSRVVNKLSLVVDKSGISIKKDNTSSIDERIAKIDEAKNSLLEGVRLIDELRETAENNKKDAELALLQINRLETDKASIQKELDSIRIIAKTDIETFRKMAGVPSATDIRRERIIGFVSGFISSLIASGVIWLVVTLINHFSN
jgi:hypothetical protein